MRRLEGGTGCGVPGAWFHEPALGIAAVTAEIGQKNPQSAGGAPGGAGPCVIGLARLESGGSG
jgi:hypothetical protein